MYSTKLHTLLLLTSSIITLFCSCNKEFKGDNYTAYFGGEVTNPTNQYILFCRNSEVIDSVKIDANNRFFIKFDSLTPGMYTFKNEPEYQYVYFDKNDSIMLRVNAKDFDNSIIFCGRGDQKNNFLMEMYMKNEDDRNKSFDAFDYNIKDFTKNIDSSYASKKKFYKTKKEAVKWNDDFDKYAKASLDLHHYSKKEIYPMAHMMRTGEDVIEKLPKDFYDFRKEIDFNDTKLSNFSPFVMYLSHMLNNVSAIHYHNHYTPLDLALRTNINKLNFADSLIKNKAVKNTILNNIAFTYLLEDQNMVNNQIFLETYYKFSTDKSQKNEILKIGNAIQLLKIGNTLPKVELVNTDNQLISSEDFTKKKTILFLWTDNLSSHMIAAHKKVLALKAKHPDYQIIGINLDKDQKLWKSKVEQLNHNGIIEYRCTNFEDLKANWAIMKVHRTIILDQNGNIKNAFTNLFDVNFEKELD
jgi:peroxiredoxin